MGNCCTCYRHCFKCDELKNILEIRYKNNNINEQMNQNISCKKKLFTSITVFNEDFDDEIELSVKTSTSNKNCSNVEVSEMIFGAA